MDLIPTGGSLYAICAAIIAVAAVIWRVLAGARKAGIDSQKARQAEAREKELADVQKARNARNSVPPGGMPNDPYRRD